jgi:hypothetical protein
MSGEVRHMCSYRVREAWGQSRYCLNRAKYLATFTLPVPKNADRGETGVQRSCRCVAHATRKFLPKMAQDVAFTPLRTEGRS